MKKFIGTFLALLFVLGLFGCKADEPKQDLSALADEELYQTVVQQIYDIEDKNFYDVQATMKALNDEQKVVYILDAYDMEVQNGGLCQFFMNDGADLGLLVSDALKTLGAAEHQALYDGFLADNNIDEAALKALSDAQIDSFDDQYDSYPFEAFDDAYYALPPLYDMIEDYMRSNLSAFS